LRWRKGVQVERMLMRRFGKEKGIGKFYELWVERGKIE